MMNLGYSAASGEFETEKNETIVVNFYRQIILKWKKLSPVIGMDG